MKEEIFLSFKSDYCRPILYGIKEYEYRKRFTSKAVKAYLYLSHPVQEVIGVLDLGKPLIIEDEKQKIKDSNVLKTIKLAEDSGDKVAIPILSFSLFKNPITLEEIKEIIPDFFVPQSYIYLNKQEKLLKFLKSRERYQTEFIHSHDSIYLDNFCVSCAEMEQTEEFKKIDKAFSKSFKSNIIKSKYLISID